MLQKLAEVALDYVEKKLLSDAPEIEDLLMAELKKLVESLNDYMELKLKQQEQAKGLEQSNG